MQGQCLFVLQKSPRFTRILHSTENQRLYLSYPCTLLLSSADKKFALEPHFLYRWAGLRIEKRWLCV